MKKEERRNCELHLTESAATSFMSLNQHLNIHFRRYTGYIVFQYGPKQVSPSVLNYHVYCVYVHCMNSILWRIDHFYNV